MVTMDTHYLPYCDGNGRNKVTIAVDMLCRTRL